MFINAFFGDKNVNLHDIFLIMEFKLWFIVNMFN